MKRRGEEKRKKNPRVLIRIKGPKVERLRWREEKIGCFINFYKLCFATKKKKEKKRERKKGRKKKERDDVETREIEYFMNNYL